MNDVSKPGQIDLAREAVFGLGAAEIRPATREVIVEGRREMLEPRVMQVLVALARRRGEVVSRDDLIMSCWAGRVVGDDAINRCIARVRRLSETHGGFSLETIARVGYRLTESAHSFEAKTPPPAPDSPVKVPLLKMMSRRGIMVAAILLFVLTVFGLVYWVSAPTAKGPAPARELVVSQPERLSIAVLPFTPLYDDRDAQQFGDSIAFRVADMLSGSAFNVISPTRSFQFRGGAKAGAAQVLHADFLIDGEVHRAAGIFTISIRIIEGSTGTTVTAGSLKRPANEVTDVPEQVAGEIAEGMDWLASRGFTSSARWDPHVMAGSLKAMN